MAISLAWGWDQVNNCEGRQYTLITKCNSIFLMSV